MGEHELRKALLRIFDMTADRPDVRLVAHKSLFPEPRPQDGLDAAWAAAEAALPEGWWLRDVVRDGNATMYRWQADAVGPKHWEEMYGDGPTPAAALLALVAALREPKP